MKVFIAKTGASSELQRRVAGVLSSKGVDVLYGGVDAAERDSADFIVSIIYPNSKQLAAVASAVSYAHKYKEKSITLIYDTMYYPLQGITAKFTATERTSLNHLQVILKCQDGHIVKSPEAILELIEQHESRKMEMTFFEKLKRIFFNRDV